MRVVQHQRELVQRRVAEAAAAQKRLQAELLIKAHREAGELQPALVHEQPAQGEIADEAALGRVQHASSLGLRTGVLEKLGVDTDIRIVSAHRTPDRLVAFAKGAADAGFKVIIAGAGAKRVAMYQ